MNADDTASLIYLSLLGGAVVLWFFAQNRDSLGKVTQQALIWGLIFVGVIAGFGLWGDIKQSMNADHAGIIGTDSVTLPRASDGHYYLAAQVNGETIHFVIDTGASQIVLAQKDAERAGFDPDSLNYFSRAYTANGEVRTAPVKLETFNIGTFEDNNIGAVVNEGDLDQSLLGMDYLQRWNSVEISNGKMVLRR
ncbi:TIGR02281 family clan AA aspartic protease [Roseovarius sp. EL26]|uniref:TIGR02281 family clan AA aspartic protease n=1 Tax=Roseovarius sp. EL26 TaxID=2126672 RepID=UPI000EA315B2|nr:TIGR02281 family clan AA aspartic protease [Roseovarius sp. EL26]